MATMPLTVMEYLSNEHGDLHKALSTESVFH